MPPSTTSKVTTDHDEIRRWAEGRGAKPAAVAATESGDDPGIIRLDFPGYSGSGSLEEISWDDWLQKLDEGNLALLYQEQTASGEPSNFNKIVSRETADEVESAVGGRGRSAARRGESRSRPSSRQGTKSRASSQSRARSAKTKSGSRSTASRARGTTSPRGGNSGGTSRSRSSRSR
jgi:hypothetical protein